MNELVKRTGKLSFADVLKSTTRSYGMPAPDGSPDAGNATSLQTPVTDDEQSEVAYEIVRKYLLANAPQLRKLDELRKKGWENAEGDRYFQKQRQNADQASQRTAFYFYRMMRDIGKELDDATSALTVIGAGTPRILDMGMAPGGLLKTALDLNPRAEAVGVTLPVSLGGHKVLLPEQENVKITFADITMLAADMGVCDIPSGHPDAEEFLPQQQQLGGAFHLIICDGQVLRTHCMESYRERREPQRLATTQLVLGLERVQPGGTLVILLHKADSWHTIRLMHAFSKFSDVQAYKPNRAHRTRSSFYMVAKNVRSESPEAIAAVQGWKHHWKAATFGSDEELKELRQNLDTKVYEVLEEYGSEVIRLGTPVWKVQTEALARAPYIRDA